MDEEIKDAFDKFFSNINKFRDINDFIPSYKKNSLELSVYELVDLAGLRFFNNHYEEFGLVTKKKAQLIKEYLQSNKIEDSINELYDLFPDFLQGEPRFKIDLTQIEQYVPTYDKAEIESK